MRLVANCRFCGRQAVFTYVDMIDHYATRYTARCPVGHSDVTVTLGRDEMLFSGVRVVMPFIEAARAIFSVQSFEPTQQLEPGALPLTDPRPVLLVDPETAP